MTNHKTHSHYIANREPFSRAHNDRERAPRRYEWRRYRGHKGNPESASPRVILIALLAMPAIVTEKYISPLPPPSLVHWLRERQSGEAGGFQEKILAATLPHTHAHPPTNPHTRIHTNSRDGCSLGSPDKSDRETRYKNPRRTLSGAEQSIWTPARGRPVRDSARATDEGEGTTFGENILRNLFAMTFDHFY